MVRPCLARALAAALTLACLAGSAQATVHHPWKEWDRWDVDQRGAWGPGGHDFARRPGQHLWGADFRWSFDGPRFWERHDRWDFDDDSWERLARYLCYSLFSDWTDCAGNAAPPEYADTPVPDQPAAIPLPAGLPLLGAALAALALLRRRRE